MNRWTEGEITVAATAVRAAPSVHNSQPWFLEFHDGSISLFERLDLSLPRHDPTGRDRLISCGAALTNLTLAVRILGWSAELLLFPTRTRPDEVARLVATGRRSPSEQDWQRYFAIQRRRSYRGPFSALPVPDEMCHGLVAAPATGGVRVRPVAGLPEATEVAGLLTHTALVLRQDRAYQRELTAWTNSRPGHRPGGGLPEPSPGGTTLPWAGLVRTTTNLPDAPTLAARLTRECLLLLETADDQHRDHVLAGAAMQETWLAATHAGLVGSVLTQPLHVAEVRAGLVERLGLAGFPQALLRFGYPSGVMPPSPRVPVAELIRTPVEERTP